MQQNEPHPVDGGRKLDYATPLPPVAGRPGVAPVTISFVCAVLPLPAVVALLNRHTFRGGDALGLVGLLMLAVLAMAAGWACGAVAFWTARRNGDVALRRRAVAAVTLNVLWVVGSVGAVVEDYAFHAYKRHRQITEAQATGAARVAALRSAAQRDGVYPSAFQVTGFAYAGAGLHPGPELDAVASRIILLYGDELSQNRQVLVFADGHEEVLTDPGVVKARTLSNAELAKLVRVPRRTGPASPKPTTAMTH